VDSIRKSVENPDFPTPPWRDEKGVPVFLLDWWISLNILFRVFGDVRFTHSDLNDSSYPPLPLRRAMCEMAAWSTAKNIWGDQFASVARNVLQAGRNEAELAFATILDEEPSVEGLQQAFSKSGIEHAIGLEDYWNSKLLERLRPFSYEF